MFLHHAEIFYKFNFIIFLFSFSLLANDYNPQKVTQNDLEILQSFEKKAYDLTLKKQNYEEIILKTISFIQNNNHYNSIIETKWQLDFIAEAKVGTFDEYNQRNNQKHREHIGFQATYPIFDTKEKREHIQMKLKRNSDFIKDITNYFDLMREYHSLLKKEEFFRLKELREKVRQKNAIINLDNRLKTIEQLIKIQDDIDKILIQILKIQQSLLILVPQNKQDELKKLLTMQGV